MLRLRVKEVAQAQKLSMNLLSHRSEVSYNVIKDCYRNPYRPMSTETINKIAKALNVPSTDLLEDVSEEFMREEMGGK
jgi:lambda repressor-like predicted transcriptional regulator